jgi:hypothetical protein
MRGRSRFAGLLVMAVVGLAAAGLMLAYVLS